MQNPFDPSLDDPFELDANGVPKFLKDQNTVYQNAGGFGERGRPGKSKADKRKAKAKRQAAKKNRKRK